MVRTLIDPCGCTRIWKLAGMALIDISGNILTYFDHTYSPSDLPKRPDGFIFFFTICFKTSDQEGRLAF